ELSLGVQRDDFIPVSLVLSHEKSWEGPADVINKNVDLSEFLDRLADAEVHAHPLGAIGLKKSDLLTGSGNFSGCNFSGFAFDIKDGNRRPVFRQTPGNGLANPLRTSGDNGDFVFEFHERPLVVFLK